MIIQIKLFPTQAGNRDITEEDPHTPFLQVGGLAVKPVTEWPPLVLIVHVHRVAPIGHCKKGKHEVNKSNFRLKTAVMRPSPEGKGRGKGRQTNMKDEEMKQQLFSNAAVMKV